MLGVAWRFIKAFIGLGGGGVIGRILDTVDKNVDAGTKRNELKADLLKSYLAGEAAVRQVAMSSRVFWAAWGLFAIPLGIWWALVVTDTYLTCVQWNIPDLPTSIQAKADVIFGSIFGSGAAVGISQVIAGVIRK